MNTAAKVLDILLNNGYGDDLFPRKIYLRQDAVLHH